MRRPFISGLFTLLLYIIINWPLVLIPRIKTRNINIVGYINHDRKYNFQRPLKLYIYI